LLYGAVAVLLVSSAAALSYKFGLYLDIDSPLSPVPAGPSALLATFTSHETLKDFLQTNSLTQGPFPFFGPADVSRLGAMLEGFDQSVKASSPGLTFDYSDTNIQVAGVDEADIVKTDGNYIYVLSNTTLWTVKAYPAENAEVVSTIAFGDVYPVGIFVSGDRLCVLGNKYSVPNTFYDSRYYAYHIVDIKTFAFLYDIQDRAHPKLLGEPVGLTGSYFNSRMIGDYVYFVVSQPAYVIYDTAILPKIYSDDRLVSEISPSEIHYYNGSDTYYQYTTLVAVNMHNITEPPTYLALMLGGTSSMYVSPENMYITFPESADRTTIYRIRIRANNMTAEAKGHVLGRELNQFSMDEFNGYFRIATASWVDGTPRSNLFVLDMNLTTVGKLLDIEVGETLDSARFMANRCYLSTSVVMRDPFFVIDVTNASKPEILGYLKIPGFTRYLHPYDENHIIGVGRDEDSKVRILLFNVTQVHTPEQISEYTLEGSWSDTEVMADHRAFLFAYGKNLLALPATIYSYDHKTEQGLFVFNITLDEGIVLRGEITHQEVGADHWDYSYYVRRALYIENVLYTLSAQKMKMNALATLNKIGEIMFS
jgi:uncharacterized secreted protein with C-terminal beta-propeller domain